MKIPIDRTKNLEQSRNVDLPKGVNRLSKKKKPESPVKVPADYALMTFVLTDAMREMEAAFKKVTCIVQAMAGDCQVRY